MKSLIESFWLALGAALVASLGVLWHLYMASSLPGAQVAYEFYAAPGQRKPMWPMLDWVLPTFLLIPFVARFISAERGRLGAQLRAAVGAVAYEALLVGLLVAYISFRLSPPPRLADIGFGPLVRGLFCPLLMNGLIWSAGGMAGWNYRRERILFAAAVRAAHDSVRRVIVLADDKLEPTVKQVRVVLTNGHVKKLERREIARFITDLRVELPAVAERLDAEMAPILQRPWYRLARSSPPRHETIVYERAG